MDTASELKFHFDKGKIIRIKESQNSSTKYISNDKTFVAVSFEFKNFQVSEFLNKSFLKWTIPGLFFLYFRLFNCYQ